MDIDIICMRCKAVGSAPLEKAASLRCRCGSTDLDLLDAKTAVATKVQVTFKAVEGDPWEYLNGLLGTISTDWMEPQGGNVWSAVLKVPAESVDQVLAYVRQGRLISAAPVDDLAAAAALHTAAPIMMAEDSPGLQGFLEDGWQRGRTQTWQNGTTYVFLIPPGETSDNADAMFKTRYRDTLANPTIIEKAVPDYHDPTGRTRISPLRPAATLTMAAWGIFRRLDNTPVYGPVPREAVEIAMVSGRYGDAEFYAGTMPDVTAKPEIGGDPFRDVGDDIGSPSYDGFRSINTRKVIAARRKIMQANPSLSEERASMMAEAVVERYPVVSG